jgi:hypothetical protein
MDKSRCNIKPQNIFKGPEPVVWLEHFWQSSKLMARKNTTLEQKL